MLTTRGHTPRSSHHFLGRSGLTAGINYDSDLTRSCKFLSPEMVQVNVYLNRGGTCRHYPGSFHSCRHKHRNLDQTPEENDVAGE